MQPRATKTTSLLNSLSVRACRPTSTANPITKTFTSPIRVVTFDASGRYLLSAGDEKLVQIWDTESMQLLQTM